MKARLAAVMQQHYASIEAAFEVWAQIYPRDELIMVLDDIPEGLPYLQSWELKIDTTGGGSVLDRRWLVLRKHAEGHA